jgi:hypothetical protein
MTMLTDAATADGGTVVVKDVAEIVAERLKWVREALSLGERESEGCWQALRALTPASPCKGEGGRVRCATLTRR